MFSEDPELIVLLNLLILHILQTWRNQHLCSRKKLEIFGKKIPLKDADLKIIPVPDSARPAALGYAQELGYLLMKDY